MIRPMSRLLRFADFELDTDAYELRRAGTRLKLEKLPMDVLLLLVSRAGTMVGREEIHSAVWGLKVFVERDAAINTAVRKLRKALRDDPDTPTFIETVVGKGYRFIADVRTASRSGGRASAFPPFLVRYGGQEFALDQGENLLGRDAEARVHLDHPSVSRRHARISIHQSTAMLEDLASRNGTFLDGRRVTRPVELRAGAILGLGPFTLTFVILSAPASTKPIGVRETGED